jgi:hypothetical protein
MNNIIIKKDSTVLFLGDSITDVKFNNRKKFSIKGKNIYAFYSPFTNHDNKDDAAVVAALSKEEAISKLKKYYANASEDNIKEVEFNRDDICIICDTY